MKRHIFIAFLTIAILSGQAFSLRRSNTWDELLELSDFIVYARATKIEDIGKNQYRTTFTVKRIYKGNPPNELSFDWLQDYRTSFDGQFEFSRLDLSSDFIFFAEQTTDGYSMETERFMQKRKSLFGEQSFLFDHVSVAYIHKLPPELDKKRVSDPNDKGNTVGAIYIKWDDVKAWLDEKYPEEKNTANQRVDPTSTDAQSSSQ